MGCGIGGERKGKFINYPSFIVRLSFVIRSFRVGGGVGEGVFLFWGGWKGHRDRGSWG